MKEKTKNEEQQYEDLVIELLKQVKKSKNTSSDSAMKVYDSLMKVLDNQKLNNKDKILGFYKYLASFSGISIRDSTALGNNERYSCKPKKLSVIEYLKYEDRNRPISNLIKGIFAVLVTLLTLPISVPLIAVIHSKTGKQPLDLFNTNAEQFEKEVKLIKDRSLCTGNAFFKSGKPTKFTEDNPLSNSSNGDPVQDKKLSN